LTVALLLQTVPLVWRRTAPLRAVALSAAGVALEVAGVAAWGDVAGFFGYLALAYAVARWAPPRDRVVATVILGGGFVVHLASQPHDGVIEVIASVINAGVLTAAAWGFGATMRRRADRVVALEEDVAARDRRWEEERRAVVEEERRRIARDLHDIVGHALAAISLSAGAAEASLPENVGAEEVRTSLELIRNTSRDSSAEVRRLVGLLRTDSDLSSTTPQPTLASVRALVERSRSAGFDVCLEERPLPWDVPLGIQLAAYRVVQEGLTNAAKHAPGAPVAVRICHVEGRELVVEVESGPSPAPPAWEVATTPEHGHGIIGLGERVALYDGELRAEPTSGGGFLLASQMRVS
jgi:signal transduction histidine kinase